MAPLSVAGSNLRPARTAPNDQPVTVTSAETATNEHPELQRICGFFEAWLARSRATVAGHDVVAEANGVRRAIGFSSGEERSLYWRLTARENLEFAAALRDLARNETLIDDALRLVGLSDAADRRVAGFSQGMARRLSLARALLHRPAVLLLDEPARSLDPVGRDEFHSVLLALRRDTDTTVLLTTHDMNEAAEICDAVSVLREGRVVEELGPGDEAGLHAALRGAAS